MWNLFKRKQKITRPKNPVFSVHLEPSGLYIIVEWPDTSEMPEQNQFLMGQGMALTAVGLSTEPTMLAEFVACIGHQGKVYNEPKFANYVLSMISQIGTAYNTNLPQRDLNEPIVQPRDAFKIEGNSH